MKKAFIYALALAAALTVGCAGRQQSGDADHAAHEGHEHAAHDGHDHATHEGHDHAAHEGHDHATHEGHDHAAHESHDHATHEGHDHAAHEEGTSRAPQRQSDYSDEIIFPAAQAARIDFKVEEVQPGTFSEVIRCSGRILAAQGDEATVVAPVSGIVSFAGPRLAPGAQVARGQGLFHISSQTLATGNEFARIEAEYNRTKAEYERLSKLVDERIVSQSDFQAARADYLKAKAEYDALAGSQSERGSAVAAPLSGYLTSLAVGEGDFVQIGQPLATVSQNRRLQLRAELSQRYYPRLRTLRSANFIAPSEGTCYRLDELNGRLLSVGRMSETGSTLIPVTFEFDNRAEVAQGAFVEVFLIGAPVADAITLPLTAVTEAQGVTYVYVQLDEEGYQRREVKLGGSDGERVLVLSGLEPGERVVTRGAVHVKMASASGAIPHSHQH